MFREGETKAAPGEAPAAEVDAEEWLRCAACAAEVTPRKAAISVNGAHEHEFMNPSGFRFRVACFATAPGCAPDGPRESVWSWFPGHAWQVELCRACRVHLGWSFHAPSGASFWGLIADRVG
jgi:hypothetical protein